MRTAPRLRLTLCCVAAGAALVAGPAVAPDSEVRAAASERMDAGAGRRIERAVRAAGTGAAPAVGSARLRRAGRQAGAARRLAPDLRQTPDDRAAESRRAHAEARHGRAPVGDGAGRRPLEVTLDAVEAGPAGRRSRAVGYDAGAPRALVVWEIDPATGYAAPLARARSDAGGGLVVDGLLPSGRAFALVAAPAGADPFGDEASTPFVVADAPVPAPQAWLARDAGSSIETLHVGAGAGAIVIVGSDADGRVLERHVGETPGLTQPAGRVFAFDLGTAVAQIARELPNGRRSRWVALAELPHTPRSQAIAALETR